MLEPGTVGLVSPSERSLSRSAHHGHTTCTGAKASGSVWNSSSVSPQVPQALARSRATATTIDRSSQLQRRRNSDHGMPWSTAYWAWSWKSESLVSRLR